MTARGGAGRGRRRPAKRRAGRPAAGRLRSRPRSQAAWSRLAEAATLARPPGDLAAAAEAFRSLPPAEQMQLAREVVTTRRAELTRAYRDVIGVVAGYRVARDEGGTARVRPEVCITLVVGTKRPLARVPRARRLPEALLACWTIGGRRVLCAVPTDVDDGRALRRIRPHAAIEALAPQVADPAPGALACGVTVGEDVYAMSCRHVFGLALRIAPPLTDEAQVRRVGTPASFARASRFAGRLGNGLPFSLDSHLALVTDRRDDHRALREALGDIAFRSRALGWDDLTAGQTYWILTPDGPIPAEYAKPHDMPLEYTDALHDVRHRALARFLLPEEPTRKGHSGSPVMTARGGGMLVGMLIAGDEESLAVAIPAWHLFQPDPYGIPDSASLELWQTE